MSVMLTESREKSLSQMVFLMLGLTGWSYLFLTMRSLTRSWCACNMTTVFSYHDEDTQRGDIRLTLFQPIDDD